MRDRHNSKRRFIPGAVLNGRGLQELEQPFVMCQQWAGDAWSSCQGWGACCDRAVILGPSGRGELRRSSQLSGVVVLSQQLVRNLKGPQSYRKIKS